MHQAVNAHLHLGVAKSGSVHQSPARDPGNSLKSSPKHAGTVGIRSHTQLRDLVGGLSGRRAVGEPKLVLMLKAASGGTAVVGDGLERAEPALRPIPDSGYARMPGFRRP